jgi:hypothetical protein
LGVPPERSSWDEENAKSAEVAKNAKEELIQFVLLGALGDLGVLRAIFERG